MAGKNNLTVPLQSAFKKHSLALRRLLGKDSSSVVEYMLHIQKATGSGPGNISRQSRKKRFPLRNLRSHYGYQNIELDGATGGAFHSQNAHRQKKKSEYTHRSKSDQNYSPIGSRGLSEACLGKSQNGHFNFKKCYFWFLVKIGTDIFNALQSLGKAPGKPQ